MDAANSWALLVLLVILVLIGAALIGTYGLPPAAPDDAEWEKLMEAVEEP